MAPSTGRGPTFICTAFLGRNLAAAVNAIDTIEISTNRSKNAIKFNWLLFLLRGLV
jgi:hypothetical protein